MNEINKGIRFRNEGKFSEAEAIFVEALKETEAHFGEVSYEYAITLKSMAILRWEQKRYSTAATLFQRCNEIMKTLPPSSDRAMVLDYLIQSEWLAENHLAAKKAADEAVELMTFLKMEGHEKFMQIIQMRDAIALGCEVENHPVFGILPKAPSKNLGK